MNGKILSVTKERLQEDGSDFLSVQFEIVDGKESTTFREGFPLDTPVEEIKSLVQTHVDLYESEKKQRLANKEAEEINAQADETINELEGFSTDEPKTKAGRSKLSA